MRDVAAKLGAAQLQLETRNKVAELGPGAQVHVTVVDGRPRMVLTTLLETFGVSNPRRCVNASLLTYFRECVVPGDLSSDEPSLSSGVQNGTPLDKYLQYSTQYTVQYTAALCTVLCTVLCV